MKLPALTAALILAGWAGSGHAATYQSTPCPKDWPVTGVVCGVLQVPEDRNRPEGRQILLPVVIVKSTATTPEPNPVIFLAGGPGGSSTTHPLLPDNNPFIAERDYVTLEPRGAGRSEPALDCPGINALKGEISAGAHPSDADTALTRAAAACRADLTARGIDLNAYTSLEAARDIEDLRVALGYQQWNLFGHSYGTRLALTYLREYPHSVRSVLLDSVLPPEANFDETASANLVRSLNVVFDACATHTACAAAHPHLSDTFYGLVRNADARPYSLSGADGKLIRVAGAQVVDAVYAALHMPSRIGDIPAIIGTAAAGDHKALDELVRMNQGPSGFTWGLRLSVWCGEEMPFEDPARVSAQTDPVLRLGGIDERTASVAMCKAWNVKPAAVVENQPVVSDVPTLVMTGAFDPDTPPAWGNQLLRHMTKARVLVFPAQSHGAGFNRCGATVAKAFFHDPSAPLDATCVETLPAPDFTLKAN